MEQTNQGQEGSPRGPGRGRRYFTIAFVVLGLIATIAQGADKLNGYNEQLKGALNKFLPWHLAGVLVRAEEICRFDWMAGRVRLFTYCGDEANRAPFLNTWTLPSSNYFTFPQVTSPASPAARPFGAPPSRFDQFQLSERLSSQRRASEGTSIPQSGWNWTTATLGLVAKQPAVFFYLLTETVTPWILVPMVLLAIGYVAESSQEGAGAYLAFFFAMLALYLGLIAVDVLLYGLTWVFGKVLGLLASMWLAIGGLISFVLFPMEVREKFQTLAEAVRKEDTLKKL